MGRHSRRGPAPKGDASAIEGTDPAAGGTQDVTGTGDFAARPRPRPRGGESWSAGSQGAFGATVSGAGRHVPSDRREDDRAPGAFGSARGGHPEQREVGGGWGEFENRRATPTPFPRQRRPEPVDSGPGPRREYLDAFAEGAAPQAPRRPEVPEPRTAPGEGGAPPAAVPPARHGGKGRAFTGVAAAAVTTVLAVVVAGQVADGHAQGESRAQAAGGGLPPAAQAVPSSAPSAVPLTYAQKMGRLYPLGATLKGSGRFDTVPGSAKAPGKGPKMTYRVDVEQGLGLDGALFADAVQRTLNDDRSWAHGGERTFERVSTGKPDFVITLASPGTTAEWCAKSGLDTTEDNVSCDSAATERVMINAYRWAQGSVTYGDAKIYAYRQMLINHEVGHRLGHGHVTCQKDGAIAPVMQQQTKFLDHDGIHCLPNAWPYPKS
ncbi:DUF3152 domain-containing protein [Streptomyces sp. NRRL F-2799]|uniref:DUF3152 domain-containing protein n=1 Tax=Streptomyces sp. NRRL F-2799 TaxID=1463844 RepID=UPI00099BF16E|nr:DUF3152 domain-containing protein [Streptomyces sp. NRRL F-2799]